MGETRDHSMEMLYDGGGWHLMKMEFILPILLDHAIQFGGQYFLCLLRKIFTLGNFLHTKYQQGRNFSNTHALVGFAVFVVVGNTSTMSKNVVTVAVFLITLPFTLVTVSIAKVATTLALATSILPVPNVDLLGRENVTPETLALSAHPLASILGAVVP